MRAHVALVLLCLPCSSAVTSPCLWDSDTLDDELRGLPGAFDLVVGRWHRHGDAYYRARVAALLSRPSLRPADYDDLAVAHEHLGERTQAIGAMAKKCEALAGRDDRDGWYRYHANLGTFLAHDGKYEEAIAELECAVAIEPAAHFGRERFQIELIRFARDAQRQPGLWRQGWLLREVHVRRIDAAIDGSEENVPLDAMMARFEPPDVPWDELYTAVAGMLRFGGREGPELYRSLGLLFLNHGDLHLGWWALRRAIERGHPDGAGLRATLASIEWHWREANDYAHAPSVPPDEDLYRAVRANADAWLAAFQELETAAVAAGEDAGSDDVLRRLLAAADARVPPPSHAPWWRQAAAWIRQRAGWIELFAAVVVLLIVRAGLRRRRRTVTAAVRT